MALPIKWSGSDLFTHMLVVGATRSGKTATILKPIIYQLLLAKKRGTPLGLTVVEPKGELAQMVADMSKEMGLDYTHIDPMQPEISGNFNPMEGEINDVAEATVIVLKGLFGKQDAFFATVQELSARNVVKLLKQLKGDNLDITDVLIALRDPVQLKTLVSELEIKQGNTDLVDFFKSELLGTMADKYRQLVIGLRAQLENIISNDNLRNIMTGKSSIDMDKHFEDGGILAVNTALGMLRSSGDAFGGFLTMHLQNATFRRPSTEDDSVVPHFLIIDEYSRYINPDVEIFLSLAATYKVSGIFAIQSLSQVEVESGKYSAEAIRKSILTNIRNKLVFGGVAMDDAKAFSEMFGEDKIMLRQSTYENRIVLPNLFPDSYRDTETEEARFSATDIMDQLPRFTYVHQLMQDGKSQEPGLGIGGFVPRDWKEKREWEDKSSLNIFNKVKNIFTVKKDKKDEEDKKDEVSTCFDLTEEEQRTLEAEADKEEDMIKFSENETKKNAKVLGNKYRSELESEGISENESKMMEVEIQEAQMSGINRRVKDTNQEDTTEVIDLFSDEEKDVINEEKESEPLQNDLSEEVDLPFEEADLPFEENEEDLFPTEVKEEVKPEQIKESTESHIEAEKEDDSSIKVKVAPIKEIQDSSLQNDDGFWK